MTEEPTKFIHETAEALLKHMGIEGQVFLKKEDSTERPTVGVEIKTEDSRLLIGERGANLQAFQHLLRVLVHHNVEQDITLVVDVNDYRAQKKAILETLARRAADKVRSSHQLVILKPMSAYERRVVHSIIAESDDLATESLGEEPNRRVVVKMKKAARQTLDEVSEGVDL